MLSIAVICLIYMVTARSKLKSGIIVLSHLHRFSPLFLHNYLVGFSFATKPQQQKPNKKLNIKSEAFAYENQ